MNLNKLYEYTSRIYTVAAIFVLYRLYTVDATWQQSGIMLIMGLQIMTLSIVLSNRYKIGENK